MVETIAAVAFLVLIVLGGFFLFANAVLPQRVNKAQRFAITLVNNEGAFVALRTEKHWDRWTFEDVRLTPANPGGPVQHAAPGKLHVPRRNILYYQEIQETANVAE